MIILDEYIETNHIKLSDDLKVHLSVYVDEETSEKIHRLFFMSLRQHEKSPLDFCKVCGTTEFLCGHNKRD